MYSDDKTNKIAAEQCLHVYYYNYNHINVRQWLKILQFYIMQSHEHRYTTVTSHQSLFTIFRNQTIAIHTSFVVNTY